MLNMNRTNYVDRHRLPEVEVIGARPHVVRRAMWIVGLAAIGAAALIVTAPDSGAVPGQCGTGGYFGGNGGEYCDWDGWPDGSFMHRERVCVLGFCGVNTFRACDDGHGGRFATDSDPATPC